MHSSRDSDTGVALKFQLFQKLSQKLVIKLKSQFVIKLISQSGDLVNSVINQVSTQVFRTLESGTKK